MEADFHLQKRWWKEFTSAREQMSIPGRGNSALQFCAAIREGQGAWWPPSVKSAASPRQRQHRQEVWQHRCIRLFLTNSN
jgi:hypothetical protein